MQTCVDLQMSLMCQTKLKPHLAKPQKSCSIYNKKNHIEHVLTDFAFSFPSQQLMKDCPKLDGMAICWTTKITFFIISF
jgi:hypothetical protein